jgi:hypothetical protein
MDRQRSTCCVDYLLFTLPDIIRSDLTWRKIPKKVCSAQLEPLLIFPRVSRCGRCHQRSTFCIRADPKRRGCDQCRRCGLRRCRSERPRMTTGGRRVRQRSATSGAIVLCVDDRPLTVDRSLKISWRHPVTRLAYGGSGRHTLPL